MPLPLTGLRVLEFCQIAAGPFAGSLLADLGADVVKIERPPSGDGMRGWPPLIENGAGGRYSGNFASLNRNKRSVVADLRDSADRATIRELCSRADVILENFRPGVMARLGLGYQDLADARPQLVYCSITGYGQDGPYAQRGAYDVTMQAISGMMSVTGPEDGPPAKCGVPVADFAAGLYAAYCVVAAVLQVREGGPGTWIDCSMLGCLLGLSALQTSEYFGTAQAPRRLGTAHPRNAPYQGFYASDKLFTVAAGSDDLWRRLCAVVGGPELADDDRFLTQERRAKHQHELADILAPIFLQKPAAEWVSELDEAGVPCAPVNDFAEILADPHVDHMGLVVELELPNGVMSKTVQFPVRFDGRLPIAPSTPPAVGEHNDEVIQSWLGEAVET